jgi:diaminohydroxyphosphoribosylaminopyrimidine deaminase / 5-amino-6-(5-phosphoribosylamino)uracil reductase
VWRHPAAICRKRTDDRTAAGALLEAGVVDELVLYLAPQLMGDAARGMFRLRGLETMAQRRPLEWVDCRRVGGDLRLTLRPVEAGA